MFLMFTKQVYDPYTFTNSEINELIDKNIVFDIQKGEDHEEDDGKGSV